MAEEKQKTDMKEEEFLKRIHATFRIEAEEHLQAISTGLIELEKTDSKKRVEEIIEVVFREVHSLKGAARSVDQRDIENVCQPLESIFSALKHHEIDLYPVAFDLFYKTVEWLTKYIAISDADHTFDFRQSRTELIQRLKEMTSIKTSATVLPEPLQEVNLHPEPVLNNPNSETGQRSSFVYNDVISKMEMVRIPVSKLDPLLLQAEEMAQTKITGKQRGLEMTKIYDEIKEWMNESYRWRGRRSKASIVSMNEWLDSNEMHLKRLESSIAEVSGFMMRDQYALSLLVDNHLEAMKHVLMLPIGSLVEAFPRMVRDISHEQNKDIDFNILGTELEIDKRILEELKDPLIHLIRNSICHGISNAQERVAQNKPEKGKILLTFAAKESGQFEITLSDDGNGIDSENLMKAAIKSGNLSIEAAGKLNTGEILSLIYQSGVSTSSVISDISGRGLGLSIVREKVEKLNGNISVETKVSEGTTFHILMPMTLATFRGILVRVKEYMFILPTMNVARVMKVKQEDIKTVENHETIRIGDRIISLVDLGEVLELSGHKHISQAKMKPQSAYSDQFFIVVIDSGENQIAFKIDEPVEEQQVLVKGLGKLLKRVRNISGAAIMGSGKVVPVLNVTDLMKSAVRIKGGVNIASAGEYFVPKTGNILIAEDSITSRTLIKNILETAGYNVTTSVDGAEAFAKACTGDFDIIVSDVDMPMMNGFELTAKIRMNKKLREIPVVLITSLDSREDREHGMDVGADAYIIKSSFDQTNLLEIINKLI